MDTKEKIILALVLVTAAILIPLALLAEYRKTVQNRLKEAADKLKAVVVPPKPKDPTQPPASPASTPTPPSASTPAQPITYPVSVRSPPSAILQAFNVSGYTAALTAAVNSGTYPSSYLTNMQSDPAAWLANHPYLYESYSAYFAR